jgi:hypothetical protein
MESLYLHLLYSFPHRPSVTYEDFFLHSENARRDAKYRKDEGYDILLLDRQGNEIVID